MSLARGKYGIEYNPRQMEEDPSGLGWVVAAVLLLVFVSLVWTLVGRFRSAAGERAAESAEVARVGGIPPMSPPSAEPDPPGPEIRVLNAELESPTRRPAKLRNLLMRLEEAEKARDIEMAVSTIETIRDLAGAPAADLDDKLARRLGDLNLRRLYVHRNAQWVVKVTARRGDSAKRIASEHGSTVASLLRLNGNPSGRFTAGQTVFVMNHPRFSLIVHRRLRTADLWLNGKFFRRYDLRAEVTAALQPYELPADRRTFWDTLGIRFSERDLLEIETLLPPRTSVVVSEM